MKKFVASKIALIIVMSAVLGVFIMPQSWKDSIPFDNIRTYLSEKKVKLGLDLAGGRQLDFKVDLTRAREQGKTEKEIDEITNGVKEVLRKRIDPDGTKELNIQTSDFDGEKHIYIDISADLDTEETRALLQKHIDLEFKETNNTASEEDKDLLSTKSNLVLETLASSEDFTADAKKFASSDDISFEEKTAFKDQVDEDVWNASVGTVIDHVVEKGVYTFTGSELIQIPTFNIIKVGEKKTAEREIPQEGEDFNLVQSEVSESDAKTIPSSEIPESVSEKVFALGTNQTSEALEISEGNFAIYKVLPIPTDVGEGVEMTVAQIISSDKEKIDAAYQRLQSSTITQEEEQLAYENLAFIPALNQWKSTGLDGQYFKKAKVDQDPRTGIAVVSIVFNEEGAKLFEELTAKNINKPIAIFVGGELISAPNVNEKISGGSAQITSGESNFIDAKKWAISLSGDLNAGAIGAPVILDGEIRVKASLGAEALRTSLTAGAIGLLILALYMIFIYRVMGLMAIVALIIYAILIVFVLSASLSFGVAILLGILVGITTFISFGSFEDSVVASFISLVLGLATIMVLNTSIVLTLAGVAGIVLSIGMAVDANILIFERVREEIQDGQTFSTALAVGFDRAWTSIRDSNLSSLITCLILFIFGTSIVKGFAITLALGIIISMFTAITITRTLLSAFIGSKISKKIGLFTRK